jgi:hypothetical protein
MDNIFLVPGPTFETCFSIVRLKLDENMPSQLSPIDKAPQQSPVPRLKLKLQAETILRQDKTLAPRVDKLPIKVNHLIFHALSRIMLTMFYTLFFFFSIPQLVQTYNYNKKANCIPRVGPVNVRPMPVYEYPELRGSQLLTHQGFTQTHKSRITNHLIKSITYSLLQYAQLSRTEWTPSSFQREKCRPIGLVNIALRKSSAWTLVK